MTISNMNIPDDWKIKKLGECFSFLKTVSYSREDTSSMGDVHYIHYGDIHTKYNLLTYPEDIDIFVSNDKAQKADYLKTGDLILLDASEDYEGTTKCIEVLNVKDDKIISGLHTLALRDTSNSFADGFRAYLTSIPFVKRNFWKQVSGVKVYGISKDNLKKVLLPIPPLDEQEKIAEILSCWDEAIEKVSDLIEQKKLLKKGLMQKLLTGKTRLSGFTQPWKTVKLGEIGSCIRGVSYNPKDLQNVENENTVILLRSTNIQNFNLIFNDLQIILSKLVKREQILQNDDIVICMANGSKNLVGKTAVYKHDNKIYTIGAFCALFRCDKFKFPLIGYYFLLSKYRYWINVITSGSSINNLKNEDIERYEITIPSDIAEQNAIAEILQSADNEIEKLQHKLDLLKLEKKGLMQQLLTGKIRVKINK